MIRSCPQYHIYLMELLQKIILAIFNYSFKHGSVVASADLHHSWQTIYSATLPHRKNKEIHC